MTYIPLLFSIGDFNIKVNFKVSEYEFLMHQIYADIKSVLGGFIVVEQRKPDFFILVEEVPQQMIITRNNKTCIEIFTKDLSNNTIHIPSTISLYLFCLVLREVIFYLLNKSRSGTYLHCSAICLSDKAHIFTGISGSGKSTIASILKSKYPILSDDLGILRKISKDYFYYQTPSIEKKEGIKKTFKRYKIGSINFLKKSSDFKVVKIKERSNVVNLITSQLIMDTELGFYHDFTKFINWILNFISSFDNFNYLYFSKNKEELVSKIKQLI